MGFLLLPKTAERSRILGTEWLGYANCVSVFVLFRAAPFLHRLSGVLELRKRVRPNGAESFSLNLSGGFAVCGRRECRGARRGGDVVPTAVGKKEGQPAVFLPL